MNYALSKSDRLEFFSSIAPMLASGIPLIEAVTNAGSQGKKNVRNVCTILVERLASGASLSSSMSALPKAFDPVSISLIQAAEESGNLDEVTKELTTSIQKEITFEDNIRSALLYPIFVFVIFCGVLLMMLLFVIPRVASVFERLRVPVPITTQLLISASLFLQRSFPFVAAVVVFFIIVLILVARQKPKRLTQLFTSFPLFRTLARQLGLVRFSHTLGLLLDSGMPFPSAIELASNVLSTQKMLTVMTTCKHLVESGKNFTEGLQYKGTSIPPVYVRMLQAGEQSGTLSTAFIQAGDYYEKIVQRTLKSLTVLLEPIMIVTIGVFVGGMMLSIIAPIYGLISNIAGGA